MILFLTLFLFCIPLYTQEEKEIVIITASYNNALYYKKNLDSVFDQQYNNWHLIYIDDCSPDETGLLVEQYIQDRGFQNKVTLVKNNRRKLALENIYEAIQNCNDHAIIMILDGDDFLAHPFVCSYINEVYSSNDIWLTYGQFKHLSNNERGFCAPMPDHIIKTNSFRSYPHTPSHLRTFYAGLCKKIKREDLQINGVFYPMTYDMALMIPMIEMAHNAHFKFISDILLIYNDMNSINDHKVSKELQRNIDLHIRSLPKYEVLNSLFN